MKNTYLVLGFILAFGMAGIFMFSFGEDFNYPALVIAVIFGILSILCFYHSYPKKTGWVWDGSKKTFGSLTDSNGANRELYVRNGDPKMKLYIEGKNGSYLCLTPSIVKKLGTYVVEGYELGEIQDSIIFNKIILELQRSQSLWFKNYTYDVESHVKWLNQKK